ncbi:MAG: glycine cleavage system protein T [Nitrospirae bacterium GWC2_56_14]|nr:MAG: glycine cleavage system protein T [Nitrospirae bacterium GWC2_56_14]
MKQTVLHQKELQLSAKMTDFQGWQVPLQYSTVLDEYHAVRTAAGLFDVSFLGRIAIKGADAGAFLQRVFTRNMENLSAGSAAYGLLCNTSGRILDNALLLHLPGDDGFLLCTNAANTEKILSWLTTNAGANVEIADQTRSLAQVALQGPKSLVVLEKLIGGHVKALKLRGVRERKLVGIPAIVSRTGYTGEHGYELFVPVPHAEQLWDAILETGRENGLLPCGQGSRDMLRLEMGYALYGNEIDETRTPIESGLDRFVNFKKDFIGKEALLKLKPEDIKQKLTGFMLLDKGIPVKGGSIFSESREIGVVTSGNHSPFLRNGIGLGYVTSRYAQPGQEIEIEVKDREIAAKTMALPFYRKK